MGANSRTITAVGIVLKETNSGESDKFITVLLKGYGKMSVFCKGARNTKSKFLASTSTFCYSEFVIYTGAKTKTLASASLINSFYNLRLSYDRLSIASYFSEMSDKLILTDSDCDDYIRLLYVSYKKLCDGILNEDLIMSIFEFKFLELSGMFPAVKFCGTCNSKLSDFVDFNKVFFDLNGLLCYDCNQKSNTNKVLVNLSIIQALNYILDNPISSIFNFTISDENIRILKNCASLFIRDNIDETFKSNPRSNF